MILKCIILSNVKTTVPASSPQKKAKAPAPGNQMIAPSGSSSRNHLGGDVPVTTSQKVTMTLMKMMRLTHKQDLGQERPFYRLIMMQKNNQLMFQFPDDDKSDTVEYHSNPDGITGFR